MAHIVDIEDPLSANDLYSPLDSQGNFGSPFLAALAASKGCGLFILIDNILKKQHVSANTARLALDLLRSINRQSVVVTPSTSDNPKTFVVKMLNIAKDIADNSNNPRSPLHLSAMRLTQCLNAYKEDEETIVGLENTWQDFSLHYYRERLYQYLSR